MANLSLLKNPEFQKNLWMELTRNRLLLMPALLGAFFFAIYLISPENFVSNMQLWTLLPYGILIFLWGTKMVSSAVIYEVNYNTWDHQRMTLITPWQMSLGKLFGSTIYAWYGGMICMVAYWVASIDHYLFWHRFKFGLVLIGIGVFTHSVSLLLSLTGIRKNRDKKKIGSFFYFLVGIAGGWYMLYHAYNILFELDTMVQWYKIDFSVSTFSLLTVLSFLVWAVFGVYRNMRTELQFNNGPWVWVGFLAFLILYFTGFLSNSPEEVKFKHLVLVHLLLSQGITVVLAYYTIFSENKNVVDFRLLFEEWKKGEWIKFLSNAPLWLLTLFFVDLFGIVATVYLGVIHDEMTQELLGIDLFKSVSLLLPLNILFFVWRDLSLLLYLNLSDRTKRADMTAFVYLAALYFLIPAIISLADLDIVMPIFSPFIGDRNWFNGSVVPFLEFAVIFFLLIKRYQSKSKLDS